MLNSIKGFRAFIWSDFESKKYPNVILKNPEIARKIDSFFIDFDVGNNCKLFLLFDISVIVADGPDRYVIGAKKEVNI